MRCSNEFKTAVLADINYYAGIGLLMSMVFGAGVAIGESCSSAIYKYVAIAMIVCAVAKVITGCLMKFAV